MAFLGRKGGGAPQQAHVEATLAALPAAAAAKGNLGYVLVGAWPDVELVELVSDGVRWCMIGELALTAHLDQTYQGTNSAAYSYLTATGGLTGGAAGSTTAPGQGWSTSPVRRMHDLLAAGLKAQFSLAGIGASSNVPAVQSVMAYFFQHNDGDQVTFSADGTTSGDLAVAQAGPLLTPGAHNNPTFLAPAWSDLVKIDGVTPLDAATASKKYLWPRFYAKIASGVAYGSVIDLDVRVRFYG